MFTRLRNRIVVTLCLVALSGALCGTDALAQKKGGGPPPPPPPPGTIYFKNWTGTVPYSSMKGDGSGKAQSTGGVPTYQKHGGSRWFLQVSGGQWFAANEADNAVQLTNDPDLLHWNGVPASWTKDDSAFSICCVYDTSDSSPDPSDWEWIGQLLVIPVVWTDGVPVAGPPTVVLELRRPIYDEWGNDLFNDDEVSLARHDWSPAGDEVALTRWVWGVGWVLDIVRFTATGVESRQLATRAANPVWAPDGSRIAFNRQQMAGSQTIQDIWTTNPDGTNVVQLTSYISGKGSNGTIQYLPTWSPDGAYLAYTELVKSTSRTTYNIRRVPTAGGSPISLTSDGNSLLPYWRP